LRKEAANDRMLAMRRRDFLRLSALASSSTLIASRGWGAPDSAATARLTIDPGRAGNAIGPDFTGLSYETAQLGDPEFFSPSNKDLAGLMRRLGGSGVLRIGGNTSEYSRWTAETPAAMGVDTPTQPGAAVGPDTGKAPPKPTIITPHAIRNLHGFVDAVGWKLIYGLNLGTGTPETAAEEAAYVFNTFGPRLIAFQLCNEPDLFSRNGIRKAGYAYPDFAREWRSFYEAIKKRVPDAPFAGPDTAFNNEWLLPFANEFKQDIVSLSQHYYAEGPPADPSMTIERLLKPNPKLESQFAGMAQTRKDTGLPFRLAETNSCYSGGKEGVSDTFASALWGAELMYQLAQAGGEGINFHGGGFGWYTPIAGTREKGFAARPIFYGMLLFAQAGAGKLLASSLEYQQDEPLLTAYSLRSDSGSIKTVIFNKHKDRNVRIAIQPQERSAEASVLRLTASGLEATTGVTLGANSVGPNGKWEYSKPERVSITDNAATIEVPSASAALVSFKRL
jgi:hypothetical protein